MFQVSREKSVLIVNIIMFQVSREKSVFNGFAQQLQLLQYFMFSLRIAG